MHPEHMGTHGRPQQQAQLRTPSTAEAAARQRNLLSGLRLKLQPGAALQAAHACAEQAATRRKSCALPGMTSRPLRALAQSGRSHPCHWHRGTAVPHNSISARHAPERALCSAPSCSWRLALCLVACPWPQLGQPARWRGHGSVSRVNASFHSEAIPVFGPSGARALQG